MASLGASSATANYCTACRAVSENTEPAICGPLAAKSSRIRPDQSGYLRHRDRARRRKRSADRNSKPIPQLLRRQADVRRGHSRKGCGEGNRAWRLNRIIRSLILERAKIENHPILQENMRDAAGRNSEVWVHYQP